MKYSLHQPASGNKVSPIHRTYSHKETCPDTCPLKNGGGCYAENFRTNDHWKRITSGERGKEWREFLREVKQVPRGVLIRHNIAGDLPHNDGAIDADRMAELTEAMTARRKLPFTYTHHKLTANNTAELLKANESGFTVNVSANNVSEAVRVKRETGLPVVTLLPMDAPKVQTVDGVKIVACPAENTERVNCGNCAEKFCAAREREYIIGFRAHGSKKKSADIIATSAAG